jgi:2-polyprenyl-6-hydroxyphenyl methylase/3-demethylubiquinone-9 3-methyltransferase
MAATSPAAFDVVTCLELLEHVPEPASTVAACGALVRPGGHVVFSTLNRNPRSYLLAILGAEYILRLLPRGTHDWSRFLRPSELARYARRAGLEVGEIVGMTYNPLARTYRLTPDTSVNYLMACRRSARDA